MRWSMSHSFTEYFLRVFEFGTYNLDSNDSPELFKIRKVLHEDKRYRDVRDVLMGVTIQEVIARRTEAQKDWPSTGSLIKQAMLRIAVAADIMVSTTHGSLERFTKIFNKEIAKVTVIDEVGCILHAEAMIPWRNSRPLLLAGDINQLPSAVISKNKRINVGDKEIYATIFGTHGSISFLQMIMTSGCPVSNLTSSFESVMVDLI
jgi:hypothetical protein